MLCHPLAKPQPGMSAGCWRGPNYSRGPPGYRQLGRQGSASLWRVEEVSHLGGDFPAGVRGSSGGRLLDQSTGNLGGGHPPSVPSCIETALGWPGGRDSVDFGPGTASPKGNVGPPSLSKVPLSLTPPQLLILTLEGVAGRDQGRGAPGEHIWTWVVARLTWLRAYHRWPVCLLSPPGTSGSSFSLSLWL